jgi:urease accessory protein
MRALLVALAGLAIPGTAMAHTGIGAGVSFMHGFSHPILGIDHVLAMLAVGLLAFAMGGRARWSVPAAFLVAMVLAAVAGAQGLPLPLVELGVGVSVVVIGAAVTLGRSLPVSLAVALAGGFALFHGHAHGAEIAVGASSLAYGFGFVFATALLHAAGAGVGYAVARITGAYSVLALRAGGAAIALAGAALLGGAV